MYSSLRIVLPIVTVLFGSLQAKDGHPAGSSDEYTQTKKAVKYVSNYPDIVGQQPVHISVVGQGVAPLFARNPAQSYALAKRAAMADAYRLLAEKVKGVKIDGGDTIENMMVKSTTVRAKVSAMVKNANVVSTTFKDGLCEVEMELKLDYNWL